jgi:hypothetical protein
MESPRFYDAHCHALSLSHPSFLAFTQTLRRRGLEEVYAQVTAPNYLITALFFKTGERIRNMLSVMERDARSVFELMEDDLAGAFARPGDGPPLLSGGHLRVGGESYGRLVLCPLIMDFQGLTYRPSGDAYYDRPTAKPLSAQVRDVLEGIRDYRRERPAGFLEIRPFLGVDTRHYLASELEKSLEAAFEGYARGVEPAEAAFRAMTDYDEAIPPQGRFAGVKVYPPLGFDPWPEGGPEREKVELLWAFCQRHDIPIVTHCDDQGFRVSSLEDSWRFTSPRRWEPVLRAFPSLRVDFAHFGAQYSHPIGRPAYTEWTDRIVMMMAQYPQVYADISFDGSEPGYYLWLEEYLAKRSTALATAIEDRLIFGSDFMVNLTKVRSYSDYYRIFSESPLDEELKYRLAHVNPERFLVG